MKPRWLRRKRAAPKGRPGWGWLGRREGRGAVAAGAARAVLPGEEDAELPAHLAVLGALDELLEVVDGGVQVEGAAAPVRVEEDVAEVLPVVPVRVAVLVRWVGDAHLGARLLRLG